MNEHDEATKHPRDINAVNPSLQYSIAATSAGTGVGRVDAKGSKIEFDRSWNDGPSDLVGPAELLASAFAACLLKNIERFSQLLPFSYEEANVDVFLRRVDAPPHFDRIDYVVKIATDEPASRVDLLHRNLKKYGTVYNTLASTCAVAGRIDVDPTSQ